MDDITKVEVPAIKWAPFTQQMLDNLLVDIEQKTTQLMRSKGAEYAHGTDRLDNFRRNAASLAVEPETVWMIYIAKHWDAITTYVKDLQSGVNRERSEPIEGRFHDMINYLMLGCALIAARETQGKLQFPSLREGIVPTNKHFIPIPGATMQTFIEPNAEPVRGYGSFDDMAAKREGPG